MLFVASDDNNKQRKIMGQDNGVSHAEPTTFRTCQRVVVVAELMGKQARA